MVAATRIIGAAEQKKLLAALAAAGVKGTVISPRLIAGKLCSGAAFVPLVLVASRVASIFRRSDHRSDWLLLAGACLLGWRFPEVVLSRLAARRRVRLETGMPDALDLLVICAEAGLSLDHAIEQVGRVLSLLEP